MRIRQSYVDAHLREKLFVGVNTESALTRYVHRMGWLDTAVNDSMIFSYRKTYYTKKTFSERLHTHDYYELLIYVRGDVEYITEDKVTSPSEYSVIWFKPRQMHTARLLSPCEYERYVLCFDADFFTEDGTYAPMLDFIENGAFIRLSENKLERAKYLLSKISETASSKARYVPMLAKAFLVELFDVFNSSDAPLCGTKEFTDGMAKVKRYIDENFKTVTSVQQIAESFFYSREHLTRKFKETYNISVFQYLSKKRIIESLPLLCDMSVADAAYTVGFRSQSAYISAFKKNIGCLPSEYKAKNQTAVS